MTALTTEDVRALRRATDLCFDANVFTPRGAQIRALSGGRGGPTAQQTYVVPVEGNRVQNYGRHPAEAMPDGSTPWDCFYMAMNAQHVDHMRTFVGSVSKGDRLGFVWIRDNNSPLLDAAGLVVDGLNVQVVKSSGKVLTFRIATAVSLDNSARMVRRRDPRNCC